MDNGIFKWLLTLAILVFLVGVFVKLDAPLVEWDAEYLSAAELIVQKGKLTTPGVNPPLYILFLAQWFTFFGQSASIARLANAVVLLLTGYVVYQTAKSLGNRKSGMLAAAIYLLAPVVIQGSTLMDTGDTSLLPLGFSLFMWMVIRGLRTSFSRLNIFLVALALTLCFWLKITSTIGLLVGVCFWLLVKRKSLHPDSRKAVIAGIILGIMIFLTTWISFSMILLDNNSCRTVLLIPFSSLVTNLTEVSLLIKITKSILYALRIAFWFSPFLLVLFLLMPWLIKRQEHRENSVYLSFLGWTGFIYFSGYLIIGGSSWGFPRYQAAILPFFTVSIAVLITPLLKTFTRKEVSFFLGSIICIPLFCSFVLNDPLLLLNLKFKEAVLSGSIGSFVIKLFVSVAFYLTLPMFTIFVFRGVLFNKNFMEKFTLFLFIGIIISNLFLDIKHIKSADATSYEYGASGKNEVVAFVLSQIDKGDTVLATPQFLYEFSHKQIPYVPWRVWISTESVFKELRESKPKVFILGLTTHTVRQLQNIHAHPQIKFILNKKYQLNKIGTYSVWIKRNKA